MGLWSKKKVDPLDLNKGYEWTKDDQVAVEELNAMTNCSLYAQDFVEKLVTNIDVSEAGLVGTPSVTLVDGDGATEGKPYKKFKFANLKGEKGDTGGVAPVVQGTGTATGSVMSQNAVTKELESKANIDASNLTDENVTSWGNKLGIEALTTELDSRAKSDASNLTDENVTSWANKFFPVGSIYMSVNSTSPASFLGGTWEQIKDKFLLGSGDTYTNGATGGEATHTLTVNEMPSHTHAFMSAGQGGTYTDNYKQVWTATGGSDGNGIPANLSLLTIEGIQGVQNTGGSQAHNNMPPYLAVYMWKRTA